MTLERCAKIAEIVSGFAIVVSLVFLIFEVRENSAITRSAAFDRSMEALNAWRYELARSPELARTYGALRRFDREPTEAEVNTYRRDLLNNALLSIYENAYYSNQYGLVGPAEWTRFEVQLCSNMLSMDDELWEWSKLFLTEEFVRYAEKLCPRNSGPSGPQ